MEEQTDLLGRTLGHFKVKAKVVNVTQGPSVTRFEVKRDVRVKVSRIRNLEDNIKLNLAAVVSHNQAMTSLLQRRFSIGYNRAAR